MTDRKPPNDDNDQPESFSQAPTLPMPSEPNGESTIETELLPADDSHPQPERETPVRPPTDRYQLGDQLGEGGMAVVYLAQDGNLDRTVAVKTLRTELADDAGICERFVEEARIMGSLEHPGTIPVYETGTLKGGELYLAMKKVKGRTFLEVLRDRDANGVRDRHTLLHLIHLFERICQTMAAVHGQGVIHRDLKPENIMVDDFGAIYVMDWGLAKRLQEEGEDSGRTRFGMVMGTPQYMSPEQAEGYAFSADTQTDVFSLGVILYEILTGARPFRGKTGQEIVKQVLFSNPDYPRKVNPRAGRTLSAICMKALDKDPSHRYPSARELAEDVRRFLEHRPTTAIKPRPIDRLFNWSRRHPRLATMLGTLVFVTVVALFAIGSQAAIERQKVEGAYEILDSELITLAKIDREIDAVSQALEESAPSEELEVRLEALEARRDVQLDIIRGFTSAIVGFTFFSPEEKARAISRRLALDSVELHLQQEDWVRAHAQLEWIRKTIGRENAHRFTPEQKDWIEARLVETEAALKKQGLWNLTREVEALTEDENPLPTLGPQNN